MPPCYLKVTGPDACTFWRTGGSHRAILTMAASKFPPKVVLPVGVAAPAAGSAEVPAGRSRPPAITASVPLAADSLAEAASNEYGGGLVVVAESATVPAITPTPEPSSKPVPPQVNASSNLLPVGGRWRTNAS